MQQETSTETQTQVPSSLALPQDSQQITQFLTNVDGQVRAAQSDLERLYLALQEGTGNIEEMTNQLVAVDGNIRELQALANQSAAVIGGLMEAARTLVDQRNKVARQYKRAFEAGIMHSAECADCFESSLIEDMAERMLEAGNSEEVIKEEQEKFMHRIKDAQELFEEWSDGDHQQMLADIHERAVAIGIVDDATGNTGFDANYDYYDEDDDDTDLEIDADGTEITVNFD